MRDPNRIDEICARLAAAWKKHPDLRLGQIVLNSTRAEQRILFNVEDAELISAIEVMMDGGERKKTASEYLDERGFPAPSREEQELTIEYNLLMMEVDK